MRVALGLRQRRKDSVEALFCFVISSLGTYSKKTSVCSCALTFDNT